ncbi:MAG: SH3 domain-containing protein [bacterium]|nr:SH3 domain-containing protein [bacterium]
MKKLLLFFIPFLLALIFIPAILFFISISSGKGALQVTSIPKSHVYLNGKLLGETPFCKCELPQMIKSGEYTIRLVPKEGNFSPFEEKIKITKSVLTAVDRIFGKGATSHGSVITLTPMEDKKAMQLLVLSLPDRAATFLDSSPKGVTPLLIKKITESDHELTIRKSGYKEKTVRIRTVLGYKLEAFVLLGVNDEINDFKKPASPSATPAPQKQKVIILQTPTGFLRVRENASLDSREIGRVNPGETFEVENETKDWLEIKLADGKTGWISTQYAENQ